MTNKYRGLVSTGEDAIIQESWEKKNPSIFLNYFVKPPDGGYMVYPGSVRHAQYLAAWKAAGMPASFVAESAEIRFEVSPKFGDYRRDAGLGDVPKAQENQIGFFEKRGFILLPWQLEFFRDTHPQRTIIGVAGTGKTVGMGMLAMYYCATLPHFKFLNIAPSAKQAGLMVQGIRERIVGSLFEQRFLLEGRKGYREKPYATFNFVNQSLATFMNVAKNADNIQSEWADWINLDEAGLIDDMDETGVHRLDGMLPGIITRLRGERPDGKPRLGIFSMISMAYYCPPMWRLYDLGTRENTKRDYYSATILHKDNPYLTPKNIENIRRGIPIGQEGSWLRGERPPPEGAMFASTLLLQLYSESQFKAARDNPETIIEYTRPGITTYQEPPIRDHIYVITGDPGLGDPPYRNAPCIQVWDVTRFPYERARLVGFWWGYANGSLMPFIDKFDEWKTSYRVPISYRGYDSTASQRHIAELLAWTGEDEVVPLGFEGAKKAMYLNAAKVLLSKGLLQIPKGIDGIEDQMRAYHVPDDKLAQDIVSTLCMAAYLMMPLYREAYPEGWENDQSPQLDEFFAAVAGRSYRASSAGDRTSGRSTWEALPKREPGSNKELEHVSR